MKNRLNISIDDVSPHPMSSIRVVDRCMHLLGEFPDLKFSLFVPASYWRTIGPTATKKPLRLDEFPSFCDELRSLPTSNFEIGFHGNFHGIPGKSNNDELEWIDYKQADAVIKEMKSVVAAAGLIDIFKPMIRPPAWRMSPHVFDACIDNGIDLFALSSDEYALKTYRGAHIGKRVVFYDCCPPHKPLFLRERTEVLYHACEWDGNWLGPELYDELEQFLLSTRISSSDGTPASDGVEFVFMDGLL